MANLKEERIQVLKMIENGVVSAEQGLELMNALDEKEEQIKIPSGKPKWIKIRVEEGNGNSKVRVNLPISLVNFGLKMAEGYMPEEQSNNLKGIDFAAIAKEIQNGAEGKLVDVYDEESGDHVTVSVDSEIDD